MDEGDKVTPLGKASPKQSRTSKPATSDEATKAAQMILSCYPDYGKAAPEYIVNIIDALSTFPSRILVKLCNLREGIPAKHSYLPTVADIVQMGEGFLAYEELEARNEAEDRARVAAQMEKAEFWKGRQAALERAQRKYKTAFLTSTGELKYCPELEAEESVPESKLKLVVSRNNGSIEPGGTS
jgi:hypothetical protein